VRLPLRLAIAALALIVVAPACSGDEDKPVVAEISTTTDPASAADMEPEPPPLPAADIASGLETAVTAADFCKVLAAMDVAMPDPADRAGATSVYRALATSVAATRPFVPAELRTAWETVVVGTSAAADAVEAHDGDVADPEVEAALTSAAMVQALQSVERYQLTTCPAPPPSS